MDHAEYRRLVPGADTAVLCIHGIVGTPNHFRQFLPLLPPSISVINLLLDGHGKGVRDFSRSSMAKWEAQVDSAVDELLASHGKVYILAHSLGTLLAIEQAAKKPIAGLFLLAVPIKLFIRPRVFSTVWKVYSGRIRSDDLPGKAAYDCCGVQISRNLLLYLGWVSRFWELLRKIQKTRKLLPLLHVPCVACQSRDDELVSVGSVGYLKEQGGMQVFLLENSSHYYYEANDLAFLTQAFTKFILP